MRKAEIGAAILFLLLAGILIRESLVLGAGWGDIGPQAGFFPFWLSLSLAVASLLVILQAARRGYGQGVIFASREGLVALGKVLLPLAGAVALLSSLGFYLVTALYLGIFSAWIGRHRWYTVLAVSILTPLALFLAFERGFRIPLPKSPWYGDLIPF